MRTPVIRRARPGCRRWAALALRPPRTSAHRCRGDDEGRRAAVVIRRPAIAYGLAKDIPAR